MIKHEYRVIIEHPQGNPWVGVHESPSGLVTYRNEIREALAAKRDLVVAGAKQETVITYQPGMRVTVFTAADHDARMQSVREAQQKQHVAQQLMGGKPRLA
jgi:hypothetical protein